MAVLTVEDQSGNWSLPQVAINVAVGKVCCRDIHADLAREKLSNELEIRPVETHQSLEMHTEVTDFSSKQTAQKITST